MHRKFNFVHPKWFHCGFSRELIVWDIVLAWMFKQNYEFFNSFVFILTRLLSVTSTVKKRLSIPSSLTAFPYWNWLLQITRYFRFCRSQFFYINLSSLIYKIWFSRCSRSSRSTKFSELTLFSRFTRFAIFSRFTRSSRLTYFLIYQICHFH